MAFEFSAVKETLAFSLYQCLIQIVEANEDESCIGVQIAVGHSWIFTPKSNCLRCHHKRIHIFSPYKISVWIFRSWQTNWINKCVTPQSLIWEYQQISTFSFVCVLIEAEKVRKYHQPVAIISAIQHLYIFLLHLMRIDGSNITTWYFVFYLIHKRTFRTAWDLRYNFR